jgi:hypothetical protein
MPESDRHEKSLAAFAANARQPWNPFAAAGRDFRPISPLFRNGSQILTEFAQNLPRFDRFVR